MQRKVTGLREEGNGSERVLPLQGDFHIDHQVISQYGCIAVAVSVRVQRGKVYHALQEEVLTQVLAHVNACLVKISRNR